MTRLTRAVAVRPEVATFTFDRDSLGCGIVHLGCGAFFRAHLAVYTDTALDRTGGDWLITAASLRGHDVADALSAQDGLYAVLSRGAEGTQARLIGSVTRVIAARRDRSALLDAMSVATTRIVSLTVTEKAYGLDRRSGGVDATVAVIAHDLANPQQPEGVIGLLVEALRRRRDAHVPPFTLLCCDNLPDNGPTVRRAVLDFVSRLEASEQTSAGLGVWIESHVAFPATMVDRITPAATETTYSDAARLLGCTDRAAIETEPFTQWVIQDHFPLGRPGWEAGGALVVADVTPYETMKLRMLNGAHSLIAYAGVLLGLETVFDAIGDTALRILVTRHMQSAAATLDRLPDMDLANYADQLLSRFSNPAIAHRTRQIAMDGSEKLPQRILSAAVDARSRGQDPRAFIFATAVWMHFCRGLSDDGDQIPIDDPRAADIRQAVQSACTSGHLFDALQARLCLMPPALLQSRKWREDVVTLLDHLQKDGVRRVVETEAERVTSAPSTRPGQE